MSDTVVELPNGRRVLVPDELWAAVLHEAFFEAGLWLPCPCADCGEDTLSKNGPHEHYMVRDELWALFGAGDGYLCVGCLEGRLGRTLTHRDFKNSPANAPNVRDTARLRVRKARRAREAPEP
jgi:hypothetical protein